MPSVTESVASRFAGVLTRNWPLVTPRTAADAAYLGWVPLVLINLVLIFVARERLGSPHSALHHLYDACQLIGLATASWALVFGLWRLPPTWRLLVGCGVVAVVHYALLGVDLDKYLRRRPDSIVPWRLLFALASTFGLVASFAVALRLSQSSFRVVGLALGVVLGVANHFVVPHDYPALHLILAWGAASLVGMSSHHWSSRVRLARSIRAGIIAASGAAILSYVVVPGAVVRTLLLRHAGSVAAPFVARVWTRLEGTPTFSTPDSPWFSPRRGGPPIPAQRLPGAPATPIVILLTVDALRADVIDEDASMPTSAPSLLEMADSSLRFSRTWSPAPYTEASLRSLFLGTYYLQHDTALAKSLRRKEGQVVSVEAGPYLVELLGGAGVRTVQLLTDPMLSERGPLKICRGFEEEVDLGARPPVEAVVSELQSRLSEPPAGSFFIYSHVFDTHAPYTRGGERGSEKQRYLAEVAVVDAAIGELRRALRDSPRAADTYLIVTSDHGEAFGEHGYDFHSSTVYEEMVTVPLLLEGPGIRPRRVDRSVSVMDVGPTILSLFGLATPSHFMGESLVPFMRGEDPTLSRPLAVGGGRAIRAMLFDERWKAIVDARRGTEELYDLTLDPGERNNLAETPDAGRHISMVRAFFAGLNPRAPVE